MKNRVKSLLKNWPMAVMLVGYMIIGGVAGFFGAQALFEDGSTGARLIIDAPIGAVMEQIAVR